MRELIRKLIDCVAEGRKVAYCRLVETRGSTPQKAGAAMLVFADGSQFATLGGGCVEAEVKRRALAILVDGKPQVLRFQLDEDYGWDDGLICGGRMQVLVEPLTGAQSAEYFKKLHEQLEDVSGCTEAIVFDEEKSGLPATTSYLFDAKDQFVARLHGQDERASKPPASITEHLEPVGQRPQAKAVAGVAYLPALSRCRLLIVGGGHIGQAVGNLAADLDFDVWVVDDREEYANKERFPRAERIVVGKIGRVLSDIDITPDTYCLIVTRGHNHDEEALFHLAEREARYVGMIGSKRKIKLIFDDLLADGISSEALARVYAPVGIDIGSQTVPEIAVSILSEMIAYRNLGGRVPGRDASVPVGQSM